MYLCYNKNKNNKIKIIKIGCIVNITNLSYLMEGRDRGIHKILVWRVLFFKMKQSFYYFQVCRIIPTRLLNITIICNQRFQWQAAFPSGTSEDLS